MSSKARFQNRNTSPSKSTKAGPASRTSAGSGSKRGGNVNTIASGFVSTSKSAVAQVIFNGKIVTPQSLIPRKGASQAKQSTKKQKEGPSSDVPTIDESAPADVAEKISKPMRKFDSNRMSAIGSALNVGSVGAGSKKQEETCLVRLSETNTQIVFSLTSYVAPSDIRDIILVDERNNRYEALIQAHKNVEGYSAKPTQTLNYTLKNQNEMAAPNASQDFGCQATVFEIKDETQIKTVDDHMHHTTSTAVGTDTFDIDEAMGFSLSVKKLIQDTTNVALVSPGCLLDANEITKPRNPGENSNNNANISNKNPAKRGKTGQSAATISKVAGGSESRDFTQSLADDRPSESGQIGASNADVSSDNRASSNNFDASGVDSTGNGNSTANRDGDNDDTEYSEQSSAQIRREKEAESLLKSPVLLKKLQMMERAVQQNAYHRQQLDYRDLPDIPQLTLLTSERVGVVDSNDQLFGGFGIGLGNTRKGNGTANARGPAMTPKPSSASPMVGNTMRFGTGQTASMSQGLTGTSPDEEGSDGKSSKVKKLFSFFNSELVQGRPITAMAWNAVNTDLLAVGYGRLRNITDDWVPGKALDESLQGGLVLFWSLRNPDYPERILRTAQPVTALDFSKLTPTMLAVGFLNGDVNFYDVKRESDWGKPVESSVNIHGGHSDPVWQMNWVEKGIERFEVLVTISTDGTINEWNLKKGLAVTKLMQLKRSGVVEGWISREAAGLCFDFCPTDSNCYIAGTEEGTVHRCSVSYNEQFLETYNNHGGPVYRVRFSDRWPSVFLTCSADWTINLFHLHSRTPWLSMKVSGEDFAVNDMCWCPGNSTVFASVTSDAQLHIWDLGESNIDPIASVDTNKDEQLLAMLSNVPSNPAESEDDPNNNRAQSAQSSVPPTPAVFTRYDRNADMKEESKEPPVSKLIKSLTSTETKRELTCVKFGLESPTIAVGDNKGAVVVYRVVEPVTIMHEGPLQQLQRLRSSLVKQLDPTQLALLTAAEAK